MSGLPNGWVNAEIGDLCNLINGRAFKPQEWSETGLPIIRIQNLNKPDASFNHFSGDLDDKHLVKKGDLLFAWSGTPGTSFGAHIWRGGSAALNQHIFKIDFSDTDIDLGFLRYAINQKLDELIGSAQGGVGLRHVTKGTFEKTEVAFPPRAEQTRIAAKLDELLAQVDTLKARIDGIPALLKRFRQSVLAAAVSGRLTEEWREDHGKHDTWSRIKIGEIAFVTKLAGFEYTKFVNYDVDGDLKVIKAENAGKYGFKYTNFSTLRSEDVASLTRSKLIGGEIIMVFVGAGTGQVALVPNGDDWFLGPNIAMIRVNREVAESRYLEHYCRSPFGVAEIAKYQKSTAQPSLSMKTIRQIVVLLPSLSEQTEIVRRVEQLFAFADQLEARVKTAQTRIDRLTQSILAKAFRGELVPQDSNDEPASLLLERIKAQRAAAPKVKRGRKASA